MDWLPQAPEDVVPMLAVSSSNYHQISDYWQSSLRTLGYPRHKMNLVDLGHLDEPHGYMTHSWCRAIQMQLEVLVPLRDLLARLLKPFVDEFGVDSRRK